MINYLKEQLVLKAGREIKTRGDCEYLSRMIEIETGEFLNYNTLRRFFGIDPKKVKPRLATLNILSRYIGYRSFNHLSAFHPHKMLFDQNQKTYELLSNFNPSSLASYYKKLSYSRKLNYLTDVCRYGILTKQIDRLCLALNMMNITSDAFTYDEKLVLGNSIGLSLRDVRLSKIDWELLLNDQFFNKYVFEIFVDYSSLNTSYKRFLQSPALHKQQKIFKYSVLYLRDYLNIKKLKSTNQLFKQREQTKLHPILEGRVLSLNLFQNSPAMKHFQIIKNLTVEHLYEPMTATIITSNFELYEFVSQVFSKNFKSDIYRHSHYYQVYLLMKSCYFYKSKLFKEAGMALKEITLDDFRLSYKEFLSFFYYLLDFKLNKSKMSKLKACQISQKLGYKRFDFNFIADY